MNFGILNESSKIENRSGLTPSGVSFLTERDHSVYVQAGAGQKSGYSNQAFESVGAKVVFTKEEVFNRSDVVINISPLDEEECSLVHENQVLLGFHYLPVFPRERILSLLEKKAVLIGCEIVQNDQGGLPFIESLSEIAGRMCHVIAGHHLQTGQGGRGLLIGGTAGVPPATVVIVGSTILARSALQVMLGAGAHTIVLGLTMDELGEMDRIGKSRAVTLMASRYNLMRMVQVADILIGAVFRPGEKTPILVDADMVGSMKKDSIIIDLSIDQGGCIATSRPTTLENPTFSERGVLHYCVPNITSNVSRTSSRVLSNLAVPFLLEIGDKGLDKALKSNHSLARGVYINRGSVSKKSLAETLGLGSRGIDPD